MTDEKHAGRKELLMKQQQQTRLSYSKSWSRKNPTYFAAIHSEKKPAEYGQDNIYDKIRWLTLSCDSVYSLQHNKIKWFERTWKSIRSRDRFANYCRTAAKRIKFEFIMALYANMLWLKSVAAGEFPENQSKSRLSHSKIAALSTHRTIQKFMHI